MKSLGVGVVAVMAALGAGCGDDEAADGAGGSGGAGTSSASTETGSPTTSASGGSGGGADLDCSGTETDDARFSAALTLLRERLEPQGASGGAIAIVKDGQILALGAVGSKRKESCDPVTADTLFNVGFQSQMVTRLAVLDAIEDGLLSLDTPITDILPGLENQIAVGDPSQITVRHLMTNSGMLRSSSDRIQDISTCGELADAVGDDAIIQAPPGTMHDHDDRSNAELVGLALEVVDGRPFSEAVRARVLDPLDMGGAYEPAELAASEYAEGLENGGPNGPHPECRNRHPSHGYNASITDMAKLLAYVGGGAGDVLEPAFRDDLLGDHGIHFFSDSHANHVFTAWWSDAAIDDDVYASGSYSHGYSDAVLHLARRNLGVIVLMNSRESFPWAVAADVAALYDDSVVIQDPVYTLPDEQRQDYVGTYVDAVGFDGATESTLEVVLDPEADSGLAGVLHTDDGASLDIPIAVAWTEDNFVVNLGGREGYVRAWRDEAGDVYALQVIGDFGPPFFRVP